MKFVLSTKNRVLCLKHELIVKNPRAEHFTIKGRADSDHATNPETRKIVSGLEVTLYGVPVVTRSVGHKKKLYL